MDQYMPYYPEMAEQFEGKIEGLYPETYRRLYPHVQDVVDTLDDEAIHRMTQEEVSHLAQQAVIRSGATVKQSPYGGGIIGDFAQVLLLRELFDRFDRRRYIPRHRRFGRYGGRGRFGRY